MVVGTKDPVTYYKDIKPIVDKKCAQCHSEGEGGQFSLQNYAAIKPLSAALKDSVSSGAMPPWKADGPLGQYVGDRRLTDAEASKLVGWVEQGSPEGSASGAPTQAVPTPPKLAKVDLTLAVGDAYTPAAGGDDYRCFILEWTPTAVKYVTGVGVVPGDRQLVRHASVHVVAPADVATIAARDGLDGDLGYPCMSGPSNSPWIGSYDPTSGAKANPAGIGLAVQPGSAIVLQVHYNTLHKGGPDQSKIEFSLSDTATRPGQVALLFNQTWAARALRIPANEADVPFRHVFRPESLVRGTSYDLFAADLHMHKIGKSGSVGIVRQGGDTVPLLSISDWDYAWQQTYTLSTPAKLGPQDQLYVECHYDNTDVNQALGTAPIERNWGETKNDEICIGNVLAAVTGGGVVTPPDAGVRDAGVRDAGGPVVQPPRDAGVRDAGGPVVQPPRDAGNPRPDAGNNPRPDAGVRDAGAPTPPRDAGRPPVVPNPRPDPNCSNGSSSSGSGPGVISVGRTDLSGGTSVTRCVR